MQPFSSLSDEERWAVSFYAGSLFGSPAERDRGQQIWKANPGLQARIPTLESLTLATGEELSRSAGIDAMPVLAWLGANPAALTPSANSGIALAAARLEESLQAARQGSQTEAVRLALSAYLDGFEPVEPALALKDKALFEKLEKGMGQYRGAVQTGDLARAESLYKVLTAQLAEAENALTKAESPWGVFVAAATILLREGIEALLVVVAMLAFLKKADRPDAARYVHLGWAGALLAGGITSILAAYVLDISGAGRELTEGVSALFAAAVLLFVGIWMHNKSVAGRWQAYMRERLSSVLSGGSLWMLFLLSFITVYREVFETVLFYSALWNRETAQYLFAGLLFAVLLLAVAAYALLRTSTRLPISKFFSYSSILVAVLAVVLTGKGVVALQEAGALHLTALNVPKLDWIGLYPSLQSVMAQLVVLLIAVGSMTYSRRQTSS